MSFFKPGRTQFRHLSKRDISVSYSDLYNNPIDFYRGYIYIHLHQQDIGKMNYGNPMTDVDLAQKFIAYKSLRQDSIVGKAVQTQYMELLRSAMGEQNWTQEQYSFLNSVLNVDNNNHAAILDKINKELKKGFEEQFTNDRITSMLNIEKLDDWSSKSDSFKEIEKLLKGNSTNEGFEYLNNVLERMAKAVQLLGTDVGDNLGVLISSLLSNHYTNSKELGENLTKAIQEFINNQNGATIEGRDVIKAGELFQNVTKGLARGTNSKGDILTAAGLQGLVQNQFYSLLAEIFASNLNKVSRNNVIQYIVDTVNDVEVVGDVPVAIEVTTPEGKYERGTARSFFQNSQGNNDENYGKADVKFNNVQVDLSFLGKRNLGKLTMSVGLSNKAYVKNKIGPETLSDFSRQGFSLGGGMTIGNAIKLLVDGNDLLEFKYWAYNTLGKGPTTTTIIGGDVNQGLPMAYNALQDILLTRSILYLAGGRGKEDFANFIFFNGKLMSMWDIVKYAINNNIGKNLNQSRKGIQMSIPSEGTIKKYANNRYLGVRVPDTNNFIDKAVMKAEILPGVIAKNLHMT